MKKILLLPIAFCLLIFSCGKDNTPIELVVAKPEIIIFRPLEGRVGETVWIMGKNFGSTVTDNIVKIGNTVATVKSAKGTEIFITVPEGATTGPISITVDGKTDTAETFTVIESNSLWNILK
ncbi:IPT/TIG domain-containing protein [Flagellimonas onchidii]|uniref:IPT/TIG domain-containing protein n=1 Tax=Flagellimonas onchidii TaxID=2562684 RepID=UPI0010A5C859|nr:IPT/TIG domain-containing protein [Allomuricauda onchidii]